MSMDHSLRRLYEDLRSVAVAVAYPPGEDRDLLVEQLKRIGCRIHLCWPFPDKPPAGADVVFFQVSQCGQNSSAWSASEVEATPYRPVRIRNPHHLEATAQEQRARRPDPAVQVRRHSQHPGPGAVRQAVPEPPAEQDRQTRKHHQGTPRHRKSHPRADGPPTPGRTRRLRTHAHPRHRPARQRRRGRRHDHRGQRSHGKTGAGRRCTPRPTPGGGKA